MDGMASNEEHAKQRRAEATGSGLVAGERRAFKIFGARPKPESREMQQRREIGELRR